MHPLIVEENSKEIRQCIEVKVAEVINLCETIDIRISLLSRCDLF